MAIEVVRNLVGLRAYSVKHLILPIFIIALTIIMFFSGVLVIPLLNGRFPVAEKSDVAKAILGATLSLSAMSLAVFGYSMSQIKSVRGTDAKKPYRRIGFLVYFIITLGLADALASVAYVVFEDSLFFGISLLLFLAILYGVMGSVTLWATKEL